MSGGLATSKHVLTIKISEKSAHPGGLTETANGRPASVGWLIATDTNWKPGSDGVRHSLCDAVLRSKPRQPPHAGFSHSRSVAEPGEPGRSLGGIENAVPFVDLSFSVPPRGTLWVVSAAPAPCDPNLVEECCLPRRGIEEDRSTPTSDGVMPAAVWKLRDRPVSVAQTAWDMREKARTV